MKMKTNRISELRTYSELIKLPTFKERYEYLKLDGEVGTDIFGPNRTFNQMFYHSNEWREVRNKIIVRDCGRDLAIPGREIPDGQKIFIHHMNPICMDDIKYSTEYLLNPEYLICVTKTTHDAIHYGTYDLAERDIPIERKPNDTCPWLK